MGKTPHCSHADAWNLEAIELIISIDQISPFNCSLDSPPCLLPLKVVIIQVVRDNLHQWYIQFSWTSPPQPLSTKLSFYAELLTNHGMPSSLGQLPLILLVTQVEDPPER